MEPILPKLVADATQTLKSLLAQEEAFERIGRVAVATLQSGGKILTCGNGGSAADALHLAEELVGRYGRERRSLAAVCLNADPTLLTCIGNDYGFVELFARQVEGVANPNDLLVCFTTSGNSPNILRALEVAAGKGVKTVALLGKDGGKAKGRASLELIVGSNDTARIQEAHTLLLHALLERIEAGVLGAAVPVPPPVPVAPPKPAAPRPKAFIRHVLVVEDDYEFADMLAQVLTFENCTAEIAANGMEALDKMRGGNYDGIICDLMMPRVDGKTFFKEVEKLYPYMADRFLFVTGQASLRAGLTDFIRHTQNKLLEKPFEIEQLREAIRELFQR